jgi:prolyl-tRNA synthetase
MRWSEAFVQTLKEVPQEAEIPSHQLMLRAGLIRRVGGGLYTFLPLGLRALRKVERIVREEMDRAGALEILMPALQPRELWEQSKRYGLMGPVMFRIKDRQERDLVLGPTHEEVVTDLVAHELNSYRQLPRTLYQIQTKFRDEIRPRFGLMRAKEFIMKDAYSFDTDWDGVERSYQAMYDAYVRIFARCGLRAKAVEADSGAMGGSSSHEFMVLAEAGEDGIAECDRCAYAANLERAERCVVLPAAPQGDAQPCAPVATPGLRTIEEVSGFLKVKPAALIKTLLYLADGQPIAVLVPGDRDLNEHKLARALGGVPLAMADDDTIRKVTGAPVGFAGPVGLKIPVYADVSLQTLTQTITGANREDTHLVHVNLRRDAQVTSWHDLVIAKAGDTCPRCPGTLREMRGIEVGHVFKLGTKYSEAFNASYLDAGGERRTMIMGCYGIGVTRTLQAVVEQCHDENGIVWPASVAPYTVAILPLSVGDSRAMAVATELASALETAGVEVFLDDRDERPGVKFKDADLLGFPVRVVVSDRSLAEGKAEVKRRAEKDKLMIPLAEAATAVAEMAR